MGLFRKILINGFTIRTTGYTVFSVFKSLPEATAAMSEEIQQEFEATKALVNNSDYYIDEIKDNKGLTKAYVVRKYSDNFHTLRFKALSDNELEIIEFKNKNNYLDAREKIVNELIAKYEKKKNAIIDHTATDDEVKEFADTESWYNNLPSIVKSRNNVIDIASNDFGMINRVPLTDLQLEMFAYHKLINDRNHKKQFLTDDEDIVDGEYDEDGNYDVNALFNVRVGIGAQMDQKMHQYLLDQGFKYKAYKGGAWYEKDNCTADEVRRLRKKDYGVSAVPMKYSRSDDYRKAFFKATAGEYCYGFDAEGRRCPYCGKVYPLTQIEVDHIIPIKAFRDGSMIEFAKKHGIDEANSPYNLCSACIDCNRKKGASKSKLWFYRARIGSNEKIWSGLRKIHLLISFLSIVLCVLNSNQYNGPMMRNVSDSDLIFTSGVSLLLLASFCLLGRIRPYLDYFYPFAKARLSKTLNVFVFIYAFYYGSLMTELHSVVFGATYMALVLLLFVYYLIVFKGGKIAPKTDDSK